MFINYAEEYREFPFVRRAMRRMQNVRMTMVSLFKDRFERLDEQLLWIAMLDPRSSDLGCATDAKRTRARSLLLEAAVQMAGPNSTNTTPSTRSVPIEARLPSPMTSPQRIHYEMLNTMYRRAHTASDTTSDTTDTDQEKLSLCNAELDLYLKQSKTFPRNADPLLRWRVHREQFPILAKLARKWLGCVATSVPSEHAFSKGQNTVTTRRSALTPDIVRDLVFISENCTPKTRKKTSTIHTDNPGYQQGEEQTEQDDSSQIEVGLVAVPQDFVNAQDN